MNNWVNPKKGDDYRTAKKLKGKQNDLDRDPTRDGCIKEFIKRK